MSYKIESPLPVIEGGTGKQNFVPYAVVCGGTGGGPTTDDDLQSVVSVGTAGFVLTSNGAGMLPSFQDISVSGAVETLTGDLGGGISPTAGNINIFADAGTNNSGCSVEFEGSGDTLTLNVTDSDSNTIIGRGAGNGTISGDNNTALGETSGEDLTAGTDNTLIGFDSGASLTSGSFNVLIGSESGSSYTSNESSNILINASGIISDDNTLRIGGGTGTANGELNRAFICGIDGVNVGSVARVVTEASNQLGTAVITAGSGISVTPGANTITIAATGGGGGASDFITDNGTATESSGNINIITDVATLNAGSTVLFSGTGDTVTLNVSDASNNTIIGKGAGNATLSGIDNVVVGANSGGLLDTGGSNILIGQAAGGSLTDGGTNILIGSFAGGILTTEISNIYIGYSVGGGSESNTLRLGGATGTGGGQLNQAFIHGIFGITTAINDAIPVLIDSNGQLGTVSSSARVKHNIQNMADDSSDIYKLRPVTFAYNSDASEKKQYGLIAEEVHEVIPNIVVYDEEGLPQTIQYQSLPVMLLNELQKLAKRVEELEARLGE